MILLRIPPLSRGQYLRHNAALPPLLVDLLGDFSRLLLLLRVVVEYSGSVLRTGVGTLSIGGCGVVHLVEEFEKGGVGYFCRVVDDLEGFGVCITKSVNLLQIARSCAFAIAKELLTSSPSTTHGAITRIIRIAPNIPYARIIQSLILELPPVHVLDAPETSCSYGGGLRAGGYAHGLCGGSGHVACCEGAEEAGQKGHRRYGEDEEEEEG